MLLKWISNLNFFFRWATGSSICVTLSRWFWHKTAAFFTEQCTSPSIFYRFEVSRGGSNRSLKNFLCDTIFSSHVCMRTNHLAMKCNYYARLLNSWYAGSVWREPGLVNDSSANTANICWGSLWGQTCCSVIDGKLQLKHASAAKKVTWTVQYTTPPYICGVELCTELFYAIIPNLFLCFLLIWYPYISLHF